MKINDKCTTCAHNLDKTSLDCEFYCAAATKTRTANDGTVYITSCNDYQQEE